MVTSRPASGGGRVRRGRRAGTGAAPATIRRQTREVGLDAQAQSRPLVTEAPWPLGRGPLAGRGRGKGSPRPGRGLACFSTSLFKWNKQNSDSGTSATDKQNIT